jgi:hypothetical protein
MNSIGRQAVAIFLSGALAGLPLFAASPRGLVGVAQGAGAIQINGMPFGGHASLFSGDRIVTGSAAPLMVISSPSERFRVEPNTAARVAKDQGETLIQVESGGVEFQTAGATGASLAGGVTVQPKANTRTVALVNRLANGNAEVTVYKGSVEVASPNAKAIVIAGHTALLRPISNAQNASANNNNHHKRKVWAIFIATGLSAGAVGAVLANEDSSPVSVVDP